MHYTTRNLKRKNILPWARHLDLDRIYIPTGLSEDIAKQRELVEELIRALKESRGIQFIQEQSKDQLRDVRNN